MSLLLVLSSALIAPQALAHDARLEHRGAAYQVSYQPQIDMKMRTIGIAAGTRMSNQRCRWTATVRVERTVRRTGATASLDTVLPETHVIEGQRPGTCRQVGDAPERLIASRADELRDHVRAIAERDRAEALAKIDAAHALALN